MLYVFEKRNDLVVKIFQLLLSKFSFSFHEFKNNLIKRIVPILLSNGKKENLIKGSNLEPFVDNFHIIFVGHWSCNCIKTNAKSNSLLLLSLLPYLCTMTLNTTWYHLYCKIMKPKRMNHFILVDFIMKTHICKAQA